MGRYKSAFQKLKSRISKHAKAKGVSKLYLWVDFAWSFVVYGCSPTEYILYDFCELRHCSKRKFLTMRNSRKLEQIFEDPDYASTFNDKALFNQTFSDFVRRRWLICSKDTAHTPGGGYAHSEQIAEFFEAVDEVIVKPTGLSSGRGIFKLTEKEFLADQQRYLEQFFRDGVLLEECVKNHDDLQALNPNVLNTVRVYTMTDAQNQVHILDAMLRIGQGGGVVDNFHNNGVICRIDLDTGVLCTNGMDIDGFYHNVNSYTGKPYIGVTIPRWDELKRFVLDAAMVIPSARYVAWDVAVTPDGFEMIEGNYEPYTALLQMFEKRGVYRTMMGMR